MPNPQLGRTELHDLTAARIPDNPLNVIEPADVRQVIDNLIDSLRNNADDGGLGVGTTKPGDLTSPHTFRFRTRTEANADFGGEVLEEFKYSKLFTYARVIVEYWRDNPADLSEIPRGQELIAVYDPNADASHQGWRTSGGEAANAGRIGLQLVPLTDPRATGVLQYDPSQAVPEGQPRFYDDGQGVGFYQALQDLAAPVPAPVRGQTTSYWKPIAQPPTPGSVDYGTLLGRVKTSQQAKVDVAAGNLKAGTDIVTGLWNGATGGVILTPITKSVYGSVGYIYVGNKPIAVKADLDTLTYTALGGGGDFTTFDLLEVPASVRDAVRDPSNTWAYGDLVAYGSAALQTAGAPPASTGQDASILVGTAAVRSGQGFDEFELGSTTVAWRYDYRRRNDGTSGWTRLAKTA